MLSEVVGDVHPDPKHEVNRGSDAVGCVTSPVTGDELDSNEVELVWACHPDSDDECTDQAGLGKD